MRNFVVFLGVILMANLAIANAATLTERKEKIRSMDKNVSEEAMKRKERSEAILIGEGVPVNKHLPVIESEKEVKTRSSDEIAYRALALLVVAVKGEGLEQPMVEKIIKDYKLESHFTPNELVFIKNPSPSQNDKVQFLWRYEAAWTLLWSLGYVEKLEIPIAICDVPQAVEFMKQRTVEKFLADAKLRPLPEILDQADRIYRYHWAVVDARIEGKQSPANLNSDVISERHQALNWLIGYMDQEWDDISTDT
jgi:hypothetical protein